MNRIFAAAAVFLLPASVFAGHHGYYGGAASGYIAAVLMAGVAALGYWILKQAVKDHGKVRIAGNIVGWTFIVIGLLGFLCGSLSQASKARHGYSHGKTCKSCPYHKSGKKIHPR